MALSNRARALQAYGYSLLAHKWFVYKAGKGSVSLWRLLTHDISKFLPSEYFPYAFFYYGAKFGIEPNKAAYKAAVRLHKGRNDHHFEHWQAGEGAHQYISGEMPDACIDEMVADWFGAARAYNGEWPLDLKKWSWWQENQAMLYTQMSTYVFGRMLLAIEETQERLRRG